MKFVRRYGPLPIQKLAVMALPHHLGMMAMLFMEGVRLTQQREISLLSTADVIVPLTNYLPRRGHVKEELFCQM